MSARHVIFAGLLVIACIQGSALAQCTSCTATPYMYGAECSIYSHTDCKSTMGEPTYTYGEPGEPEIVDDGGCICDACDSSQSGSFTCSYSETSGHTFCIEVAGSVTWKVPVGPEWSVSVTGSYCYDTTSTTEQEVEVTCAAGTKRKVTITKTPIPTTITTVIENERHTVYKRKRGCEHGGFTHVDSCDPTIQQSTSTTWTYAADFDDLDCPPSAP